MKTFLSFVTGMFIGAIGFTAVEHYYVREDEDYAKRLLKFAGYDHVILYKSKKENEAE